MSRTITPQNPLFYPRNEQMLADMEKHVQLALDTQLNINITPKRANKLRDLTCVLAGFPGGYQQLQEYWKGATISNNNNGLLWDMISGALKNNATGMKIIPTNDGYTCHYFIEDRNIKEMSVGGKNRKEDYFLLLNDAKNILSNHNQNERALDLSTTREIVIDKKRILAQILFTSLISGEVSIEILFKKNRVAELKLEDIGISEIEAYKSMLNKQSGIILISGITGSGRTTTLNLTSKYLLNKKIKRKSDFRNDYCDGMTLKEATSLAVSSESDFTCMGEIRTHENAMQAIEIAERGGLVIATLHGNSIQGTLVQFGMLVRDISAIQNNLIGILHQNLARKKCLECQDTGCVNCNNTGLSGLTVISEFTAFTEHSNTKKMIMGDPVNFEWNTIFQDAFGKYLDGKISRNEIVRLYGSNFEVLEKMIMIS